MIYLLLLLFTAFGERLLHELSIPLDISISVQSSTHDGLRFTYQSNGIVRDTVGKIYWLASDREINLDVDDVRNTNGAYSTCYGSAFLLDNDIHHIKLNCYMSPDIYWLWIAVDSDGQGGHALLYVDAPGIPVILGLTSPPSTSTSEPTYSPSWAPTFTQPTPFPSRSKKPTGFPSTSKPTPSPTTLDPTQWPTESDPTFFPTASYPTDYPSVSFPTDQPTFVPTTQKPTAGPIPLTDQPTLVPTTRKPTVEFEEVIRWDDMHCEVLCKDFADYYECTSLMSKEMGELVRDEGFNVDHFAIQCGSIIADIQGPDEDVEGAVDFLGNGCGFTLPTFGNLCKTEFPSDQPTLSPLQFPSAVPSLLPSTSVPTLAPAILPTTCPSTGAPTMNMTTRNDGIFGGGMGGRSGPFWYLFIAILLICILCFIPFLMDNFSKQERKESLVESIHVEQLIEDIRREALKHKDEIVLRSTTPDECVKRMADFVDRYANLLAEQDDFIQEVPEQRIKFIKEELEPIFKIACKLSDLLAAARVHTLGRKDSIVMKANSADDCVVRMRGVVDDFANDYMAQDDFFTMIPQQQIDDAKQVLMESFGLHEPTASCYVRS